MSTLKQHFIAVKLRRVFEPVVSCSRERCDRDCLTTN
jgi:hypothetical protein